MSDLPDSFADHPPTIGEIRSDRSDSASDWKPRDALIWLLREIDSGRRSVERMVVCYSVREDADHCESTYVVSGDGHLANLGLIYRAAHRMIGDATES